MDPKIVAALIAALVSLLVAVVNAFWSRRNQRELETLKTRLSEEKAEQDARRDYKYDARKRLYEECEPLFFQINEAAESALHRVLSLARTSRSGHLGFGNDSWVDSHGYYFTSTFYKLFAPLAIFKQIQRRLTLVDLTVDTVVKARYDLMKWLYLSYTDDFEFARGEPEIIYEPNVDGWQDLRQEDPQRYWRQGIPFGRLDNAVDSLLVREGDDPPRCLSFGEFEKAYFEKGSNVATAFEVVSDIFIGFDPRTRPVLWRILVTQAHICLAIMRASQLSTDTPPEEFRPLSVVSVDKRKLYDWGREQEDISDVEIYAPLDVAKAYFKKHLPDLLKQ